MAVERTYAGTPGQRQAPSYPTHSDQRTGWGGESEPAPRGFGPEEDLTPDPRRRFQRPDVRDLDVQQLDNREPALREADVLDLRGSGPSTRSRPPARFDAPAAFDRAARSSRRAGQSSGAARRQETGRADRRFFDRTDDQVPDVPDDQIPGLPDDAGDRPPAEAMAGNRLLTVLLFIGGLATSVSLWLFDTQPGAINDSATLLIAAGRITGLIGGYLLFIQLLMMSRVSWLEEWVGARDLLRWHRWLGTALLAFVLAHAVFIIFGYASQARTTAAAQTWTMLTTFQDMLSAFVATGLLVAVALLAIRGIRKRMPYELWHLLHLTGYLVLLLGYGHQVTSGVDLSGRFASVFWPGLAALVVAALVWGRVVEPLHLNLRHRLTVAKVVAESDNAFSIYLTGRDLQRLPARPGQFMRWRFLTRDGWWQSHPFSLSAAPNDRWLRLTVTAVGRHTGSLQDMQPGTAVWAEGPFGTFTAERRTRRKALLIAGGSGIAPIRALLEDMPDDTIVVYRAGARDELVFQDELNALAERQGGRVYYLVGSRNDPGPRRLFTPGGMQALVPDVHRRDIYLCGPPGLVDIAVGTLRDLEVPQSQLHLDPFEF
jgi:predicted ferric reductase